MEGVELPNQLIIRTLGEKENYKYFGILDSLSLKFEWQQVSSRLLDSSQYSGCSQ